jgi:DNA-binding response OmpR family regulator
MNTANKILVVDDETVNLDFFQVMLGNLGFITEGAGDGHEALEVLKKFHPDLILLDNIMAHMSGWELTKILKNNPEYRDIPIIMLSALDDVIDKVAGFELGIVDYITKPFNFSEVLARIKVALRNNEGFAHAVCASRLELAENFFRDMKQGLAGLTASIAVAGTDGQDAGKTRSQIAELAAVVDKTMCEWDDLKKNEIGPQPDQDEN